MNKVDFNEPIRFAAVQGDDHVTYQPKLVGSFRDVESGAQRWVVVSRNWLDTSKRYGFLIYDELGYLVGDQKDTHSSGIFDPQIINGPAIKDFSVVVEGITVVVTMDGDKPIKVRAR